MSNHVFFLSIRIFQLFCPYPVFITFMFYEALEKKKATHSTVWIPFFFLFCLPQSPFTLIINTVSSYLSWWQALRCSSMVKSQRKTLLLLYILLAIIHPDSPNSFIKTSFFLYHLPALRNWAPWELICSEKGCLKCAFIWYLHKNEKKVSGALSVKNHEPLWVLSDKEGEKTQSI